MELILTAGSMAIVAICSALAVFLPAYDDTLTQRIGLSGICIGSVAMIFWLDTVNVVPCPIAWLAIGGAIYAVATTCKVIYANKF